MTVFGIGTLELILILLVLILLFGPERIAEMAAWLGRAYRKISGFGAELSEQVTEVRESVRGALDTATIGNPLQDTVDEVKQLRREIDGQIRNVVSQPTAPTASPAQTDVGPSTAEEEQH